MKWNPEEPQFYDRVARTRSFLMGAANPLVKAAVARRKVARPSGKQINKRHYEVLVQRRATVLAYKRLKPKPTPADYAAAKIFVDKQLKARGMVVAGDHVLGISDIMGAAFIMGAAEAGNPKAKMAIRKAAMAAKAGSPKGKKQMRAMAAVEQGKQVRQARRTRRFSPFARYFRAVANTGK